MSDNIPLLAAALSSGLLAFAVSLSSPRPFLYLLLALLPAQFIFVPVSDFFVSPADVLVVIAMSGVAVRLATGARWTSRSLWQHRYLALFVLSYVLGSLVLGTFSRTLARLPMAMVPSLLACELLRERRHVRSAVTALVVAAVVDGGYGVLMWLSGRPLHPSRFAGLSGVNFTAALTVTAAAILLCRFARVRSPLRLSGPGALGALAAATLSQMGLVAAMAAWLAVLRRVVTWRNTLRLAGIVSVVAVIALASPFVQQRIAARFEPEPQRDGPALNSTQIRLALIARGLSQFADRPLTGSGFGSFEAASLGDGSIIGAGLATHNTYVEILAEGGGLAFLFFALHFAQYGRRGRHVLRDVAMRRDTEGAAALVGLPVVLIAATFGNVLLHYFFWAVCGVALAYVNVRWREIRQESALATLRTPPAGIAPA